MITLQTDIIEVHNSLTIFSDLVIKTDNPKPIDVWFDEGSKSLAFELQGKSIRLPVLNYYCLDLEELKNHTYLLPDDYDKLMYNLQKIINSGELIKERTCLSPENWGFNIFTTSPKDFQKGPDILARIRFISGKSRFFKFKTKLRYNL